MEFEYKIGEVAPILKEDIWEPSKMGIVGCVIRAIGAPVSRYDTNGKLIETYEKQLRSDIGLSVVKDAKLPSPQEIAFSSSETLCGINSHPRPTRDINGATKDLTHVLVSKSPDGVITHYYTRFWLAENRKELNIKDFGLNRFVAEKSREVVLRYSISGEFDGYYYYGPIDVIERKFGETSEFVKLLKNYYSQTGCTLVKFAFKDFGNEAVYVTYVSSGIHALPLDKKSLETEQSHAI